MQKTGKNITKFHTRGAAFPKEIEGVIQRSLTEVTKATMVFSIIVDDKRSLNIFFMENPTEILNFKRDYQVVESYLPVKSKNVKGGGAENFSHYMGK